MPLKCHIYTTYGNYIMYTYRATVSVYIPPMDSMQSIM